MVTSTAGQMTETGERLGMGLYSAKMFKDQHTRVLKHYACRHVFPGQACVGVDPNRNYDYHWSLIGASASHCSIEFHGEEPFSEPELVAQTDYILAELEAGRDIVYLQSMHSAANMILYPWGWSCSEPNPDRDDHQAMGDAVSFLKYNNGKFLNCYCSLTLGKCPSS